MPEYKTSVDECPTGDGGVMALQFYDDGTPKRTHDRFIRTKCTMCPEVGRISESQARTDID